MTNPRRMQMATAGQGEVQGYELWTWGVGTNGGLGHGNETNLSSPVQVGSEAEWVHAYANEYNMQGIKTDGTLWTWGKGDNGRNGTNNTTSYSSPVQVGSKTNWVEISGEACKIGRDSAGHIFTWGKNTNGALGNGNTSDNNNPVQVGTDTWISISASVNEMGAVRSDGTLWTWGLNDEGQLGLGNTTNYSSPVQVGSLTSWESFHSIQLASGAIKTDGTLWTWGRNNHGQQGHGNTTDSSSPVQVGSLTNWGGGQVRTTPGNTWRAIKTDGTLWFWGYDGRGMSGNGSTTGSSSPVQTGSLTNWYNGSFADGYRNMGTGKQDRVVVKSDGTLWSWGRNQFGQHGVGDTTERSTPNQVGSETIWFNAGGGTYMSAALKDVS